MLKKIMLPEIPDEMKRAIIARSIRRVSLLNAMGIRSAPVSRWKRFVFKATRLLSVARQRVGEFVAGRRFDD
jgi:hypothetical protein